MKRNQQYWTSVELETLERATSFVDLVPPAMAVLGRMPQPIGQVCGPISTGGRGTIMANLAVFDATVDCLIQKGIIIFDQMPFEEHIFRIVENQWGSRQNNLLLNEFYLPIFESGRICCLYFIDGWQSSEGATWEHEQARRLNMHIVYLAPDFAPIQRLAAQAAL